VIDPETSKNDHQQERDQSVRVPNVNSLLFILLFIYHIYVSIQIYHIIICKSIRQTQCLGV
jgi:hypothetical protein